MAILCRKFLGPFFKVLKYKIVKCILGGGSRLLVTWLLSELSINKYKCNISVYFVNNLVTDNATLR